MKNKVSLLYASSMSLLASFIIYATAPHATAQSSDQNAAITPPAGYNLVWSDEFETEGLPDPAKWAYDTYRNQHG